MGTLFVNVMVNKGCCVFAPYCHSKFRNSDTGSAYCSGPMVPWGGTHTVPGLYRVCCVECCANLEAWYGGECGGGPGWATPPTDVGHEPAWTCEDPESNPTLDMTITPGQVIPGSSGWEDEGVCICTKGWCGGDESDSDSDDSKGWCSGS